jgi:hypothetical protein
MEPSLEPNALREWWAEDRGATRDIYVPETTADDWQVALDSVARRWRCAYSEDGMPTPMPSDVEQIFQARAERKTHLDIRLSDRVAMRAHFFAPSEIEFDFDPEQLVDDADVYRIFEFVLHVGRSLGRTVHMTVESHPGDRPTDDLRYDPKLDQIVAGQLH